MGFFRGLGSKLQNARGLGSKLLGGVAGIGTKVGGVLQTVGDKVSTVAPSLGGSIAQAGKIASAVGNVAGDIKGGRGLASTSHFKGIGADARALIQ